MHTIEHNKKNKMNDLVYFFAVLAFIFYLIFFSLCMLYSGSFILVLIENLLPASDASNQKTKQLNLFFFFFFFCFAGGDCVQRKAGSKLQVHR
jgi:hypothetical protein